ncbi:type II methionyl aminopeptidase [Candidatus Pacearchaeota archaeon]|nr:MAG: type II methionyl aminopeptidase [Candidatus Pacearchaeota archaeon]
MEDFSDFIKAGKVSAQAKRYGASLIKEGARAFDIAEKVEEFILKKGCGLSFPVDVSINEIAAHYTPTTNDSLVLKKGDLVKLDLGAQYNGAVTDCAISVSIGKSSINNNLIKAAKEAHTAAAKLAKPGVNTAKLGAEIQKIIESYGFKSIKNLSGHGVGRYIVHTIPTIPNYAAKEGQYLRKGDIIAIEPFPTTGEGLIYESKGSEVYEVISNKPVRAYRDILEYIKTTFKGLPFAKRQIAKKFGLTKTNIAIISFKNQGIITEYGILKERAKGKVAQWENTIIVSEKPKTITD